MELLNYKITPIWPLLVDNGKTVMTDNEYSRYCKWLLSHKGQYEFIIKKKFKKRSNPQNAWFWGCIIPMIASAMGEEDLNVVYALLKSKFLSKTKHIVGKDGQIEEVKIVGRTSKMSTDNFSILCEKCRKFGAEFYGLNIPDPDKNWSSHPVLIIDED